MSAYNVIKLAFQEYEGSTGGEADSFAHFVMQKLGPLFDIPVTEEWPVYGGASWKTEEGHIYCGRCDLPITDDQKITLLNLSGAIAGHARECPGT